MSRRSAVVVRASAAPETGRRAFAAAVFGGESLARSWHQKLFSRPAPDAPLPPQQASPCWPSPRLPAR